MSSITNFQQRVLTWFEQRGRKNLPWQQKPTPYSVWVSEIMLQQTQVNTVIPYYVRFIERFPDCKALATAELDEVLHYWTGLGYYARARNLHKAAQHICQNFSGNLPSDFNQLVNLPGIGRSTAGAILALSQNQRYPILDGNVKRVLCRHHAIEGWPGQATVENHLWTLAEQYTPTQRVAEYTQAMMDLGAMLCTRSQPQCLFCPLVTTCLACQQGNPTDYPSPKPKKTLPCKQTCFILLQNKKGEILLEKRPMKGIWGGLWSFPECEFTDNIKQWCQTQFGLKITCYKQLTQFRHTFSHYHLDITPLLINTSKKIAISEKQQWQHPTQPINVGLAAPVKRLLLEFGGKKG